MQSPPSYNPDFVPLRVQPGEPNGDGMPLVQVQHNIVRMPPPRDHIIWSIFTLVYLNPFCLGLFALYFSVKARDRKMAGDMESAREFGSTARCLNITALIPIVAGVLGIIGIIVCHFNALRRGF